MSFALMPFAIKTQAIQSQLARRGFKHVSFGTKSLPSAHLCNNSGEIVSATKGAPRGCALLESKGLYFGPLPLAWEIVSLCFL